MTKEQVFSEYMRLVAFILRTHADKLEAQARMTNIRGKILGESFDVGDELLEAIQQLREHAEAIQEVSDNPHLLIMQ